jgi:hypothetical protein
VLLERVAYAVDGSDSRIAAFKAAVRSYRNSEMSANDLLDTFWSVFDRKMREMEDAVERLADLIDVAGKKADLLSAWRDFSIEVRLSSARY